MKTMQLSLPGGRLLGALRVGPESDKAILFCHGLGSSGHALASRISLPDSAGINIFIPQRPGVGGSDLLPGYTVEQVVEDMATWLEYLQIRSVYVAGWSTGAAYAVAFASRQGRMVKGLGLISPALPLYGPLTRHLPGQWQRVGWLYRNLPVWMRWRHHRRAEAIARYAELVLEKDLGKSAMSDRILFEQLHDRVALLQDVQEAWQHVGEGIYYDGRALSRYAWRLEGIDVPIDIWQGNADTIWTPETAIALKDSNKAAQIHLLRNEGHLIYLTRWQEIVERGMYYLK